jgi:hypothetical protein
LTRNVDDGVAVRHAQRMLSRRLHKQQAAIHPP